MDLILNPDGEQIRHHLIAWERFFMALTQGRSDPQCDKSQV